MLKIHPIGGLCNRLRVVFSFYKIAKQQNKTLHVIWIIGNDCIGYFLDHFEPIDGIIFEYNNTYVNIEYHGCEPHPNYPPSYEPLKLLPHLSEKINNRIYLLKHNYIALHIRRTDHTDLAKSQNAYTTDDDFFNFINKYNHKNLYIATDNKDTYDMFVSRYPNLIKFSYHNQVTNQLNHFRQTTLEDSIIDLYMCVYAAKFKGSGWSSYSEMIDVLRSV